MPERAVVERRPRQLRPAGHAADRLRVVTEREPGDQQVTRLIARRKRQRQRRRPRRRPSDPNTHKRDLPRRSPRGTGGGSVRGRDRDRAGARTRRHRRVDLGCRGDREGRAGAVERNRGRAREIRARDRHRSPRRTARRSETRDRRRWAGDREVGGAGGGAVRGGDRDRAGACTRRHGRVDLGCGGDGEGGAGAVERDGGRAA